MNTLLLTLAFLCLPVFGAQAQTIRDIYEQATAAYAKGDYDNAVALYEQITKSAPHFAPAYIGIGLALKDKGADIDEVLYYYKTATEMDPTNAQAFEQLGRLYYALNKFAKAEQSFLKALKIDPSLMTAKLPLAWVYLMGKNRPTLAIKYFNDVLKSNPMPNAYFGLGMAYFAANDRANALEVITKLKSMGQDDFANRLEQMVRENRRVATQSDTSDDVTPAAPTGPRADTGVKARLRGKLSDIP